MVATSTVYAVDSKAVACSAKHTNLAGLPKGSQIVRRNNSNNINNKTTIYKAQ